MKKLLSVVLIASTSGLAAAQSSVTLFGIIDANIAYGRASGAGSASRWQLANSGYNSSRLGFRGVEDLGGGLTASFWLETGVNNDNGSGQATNTNNQASGGAATPLGGGQGLTFNRRSTVSLAGSFGEVRVGRDYTPQFWNMGFDPFGVNGIAATQTYYSLITGVTNTRASNSIGYFLPANLGGIYGQAMYYMGEQPSNAANSNDGNGVGVRVGYANGPFNGAIALSRTEYLAGDVHQNNAGFSWDFKVAKAFAHVTRDRNGTLKSRGWLLGASVPVGAGEIRASYSTHHLNTGPETGKFAVGYVHNLSKRTALYGTYATLKNKNGAAQTLNAAIAGGPNRSSSGFDLGIRHTF